MLRPVRSDAIGSGHTAMSGSPGSCSRASGPCRIRAGSRLSPTTAPPSACWTARRPRTTAGGVASGRWPVVWRPHRRARRTSSSVACPSSSDGARIRTLVRCPGPPATRGCRQPAIADPQRSPAPCTERTPPMAFAPIADPSSPQDLRAFAAGLAGTVIRPDDVGYDEARQVHHALADDRPVAIVRARSTADVARTILFAAETDLELAVRGGGHSIAGYGTVDGGIVLDLGEMKALHIDPDARLAWAGAGLTAGEYTVAAAAHGL